MPPHDSPIAVVPGEALARVTTKRFLAYLERRRQQQWLKLEFPGDRIRSRPTAHAIAIETTGRTTAIQHAAIELSRLADHRGDAFDSATAALERETALIVPGYHVDLAVQEETGGTSTPNVALLVSSLRGWCARHLATLRDGSSSHVMTVAGAAIRLRVERAACPGERGTLSVCWGDLPVSLETAVCERLADGLEPLLKTSAERHVLLVEQHDRGWCASQLRTVLDAAVFEFPDVNRLDEIWLAARTAHEDGTVFRPIGPRPA